MRKIFLGLLFFTTVALDSVHGAAVPEKIARETFEHFVLEQCFVARTQGQEQLIRIGRDWRMGELYFYPAQDAISALARIGPDGPLVGQVTYREGVGGVHDRLDLVSFSNNELKCPPGSYWRTECP